MKNPSFLGKIDLQQSFVHFRILMFHATQNFFFDLDKYYGV